jgi:beta-1,4-mannosyltransferase
VNILCATHASKKNPFADELNNALSKLGCKVDSSLHSFWSAKDNYDVVIIHWPEYLFSSKRPRDLDQFENILKIWKKKSKLVIVRHNSVPHKNSKTDQNIFDLVYNYVDGVVHLGDYSLNQIKKTHIPDCIDHAVIPHHVYCSDLENRKIGDKKYDNQVLVFGQIRNRKERELLYHLGKYFAREKVKIIVPRWNDFGFSKKEKPFSWIVFVLRHYFEALNSPLKIGYRFISRSKTIKLFNRSSIVFIPRIDTLNSGIVTQAFSYGKVVVGSEKGNIGELLTKTGNPTFNSDDLDSVIKSVNKGLVMSLDGLGEINRNYALKYLTPDLIADKYLNFFKKILKNN